MKSYLHFVPSRLFSSGTDRWDTCKFVRTRTHTQNRGRAHTSDTLISVLRNIIILYSHTYVTSLIIFSLASYLARHMDGCYDKGPQQQRESERDGERERGRQRDYQKRTSQKTHTFPASFFFCLITLLSYNNQYYFTLFSHITLHTQLFSFLLTPLSQSLSFQLLYIHASPTLFLYISPAVGFLHKVLEVNFSPSLLGYFF